MNATPNETPGRSMDLLRFATAGSVDDGKSTLIGRLLLDSKAIFADQLEAVEATSLAKGYDYTDLALLTRCRLAAIRSTPRACDPPSRPPRRGRRPGWRRAR